MSNLLFGRKIEVTAGSKTFKGDDFTIYFKVPFSDEAAADIAEINIYNLRSSTISTIKKDQNIVLNAGYVGDVGSIFLGIAKQIKTDVQGVDGITTISALDGGEKWFANPVNKTYKKGTSAKAILNDLLAKTGLKVGSLKLPTNKVYQSGKAVKGTLAEVIIEVAKDCGAKLHVNRGKIYIRPKNEGDKTNIVLDADHGLIGSPTAIEKEEKYTVVEKVAKQKKKRIKKSKDDTTKGPKYQTITTYENKNVEKKRTVKGWKVVCLLNHRITTDTILTIKSKTANGLFRVGSGTHSHNGRDFTTEMEVYPV